MFFNLRAGDGVREAWRRGMGIYIEHSPIVMHIDKAFEGVRA